MPERKLLHKESYLSHLYHYGYEDQEDAPLAERHLKYIREDAQVSAGNLIDTESKAVPEIPHGPVSRELSEVSEVDASEAKPSQQVRKEKKRPHGSNEALHPR